MTVGDDGPGPPEYENLCKHTCSFGCGNEYEFVVTTCSDSSTQFLCIPCFIGTAVSLVTAVTQPDDPDVMAAVQAFDADMVQSPGTRGKKQSLLPAIAQEPDFSMFDAFEPDVSQA